MDNQKFPFHHTVTTTSGGGATDTLSLPEVLYSRKYVVERVVAVNETTDFTNIALKHGTLNDPREVDFQDSMQANERYTYGGSGIAVYGDQVFQVVFTGCTLGDKITAEFFGHWEEVQHV